MAASPELQRAARENGKKGGRPRGVPSELTKARAKAQQLLVKEAKKHIPRMIQALVDSAEGVMMMGQDKKGNDRIYTRAPDTSAIREFFDRIIGKPTQNIGLDKDDGDVGVGFILYTKRELELRDRYAKKTSTITKRSK